MATMNEYVILMPLLIQIVGLFYGVMTDKYLRRSQRNIMLGIVTLIVLLIVQNGAEYILKTSVSMPYARTLVSIAGYILRPGIIMLFIKLVSPDKKHYFALGIFIANSLAYLTATFSPWVFYITDDNRFQRGAVGYTAYFMSTLLLVYLVVVTVYDYRHRKDSLVVVLFNAGLVALSAILELTPAYFDSPVSYLTIAVVSSSLFYYIWLHYEFVHEHEDMLMAENRIKIMMSQIQPHFLYNTLSTIQALCVTDPRKAFKTTEMFGTYLRHNIDYLEQPELIPLEKELEHTRIYAEIEMIRFPKIKVDYDIQCDDFKLPPLTIQPLVENAIRHGVRSRDEGRVTVSTMEKDGYYTVVIKDNGTGFDPEEIEDQQGTHIGVANVTQRIEDMCSGTLEINSVIDEGTEITIRIPKTRRRKYESYLR